ncbi:hypothetical protein BSKO_10452 [Bryopsis sp. KO-2023]|nr:hypothetical protein BSKO_10452 [Bryopsis sp. KO-2023]
MMKSAMPLESNSTLKLSYRTVGSKSGAQFRQEMRMASSADLRPVKSKAISIPRERKIIGRSSEVQASRLPVAAAVATEPEIAFTELMQRNSYLWFEAELQEDPPLDDFVSPRCVFTDKMNGWVFRGRDAIKERMADFNRAYPDFELSLLDVMLNVDGKSAACHWAGTGTNLGPVGKTGPSGSRSRFSGVHLFTFDSNANIIDVLAYREIASEEQKFSY